MWLAWNGGSSRNGVDDMFHGAELLVMQGLLESRDARNIGRYLVHTGVDCMGR